MKKIHLSAVIILSFSGIMLFLVYYFFFTTKGSNVITKVALSKYFESENINIKKVDGNLVQTLTYEDVLIEDLEFLPKGSILSIKKIDISFISLSPSGLTVKIYNGTLRMPNFDTILFYGSFQESAFDINVYSKNVGVKEVLDLFAQSSDLKKISGLINDLDAYIKGTFFEPELAGTFKIDKLRRNGFSITNSPGNFNLHLKDIKDEFKLFGSVCLNSGVISGPKTALVNLQESEILFNGDAKRPSFDMKGTSTVEKTKIDIALKGTFGKPELKLKSDPPFAQERLLVMLATNRSWKGTETALSKGQISVDLAKDFLDYFVFSGSGSKIAQALGISDLSVKYDGQTKGLGVTKDITGSTAVSYSIEQSQNKDAQEAPTQKIGAEHKITESISIGAEKELKQDIKTDQTQGAEKADDKVFLKYKKKF